MMQPELTGPTGLAKDRPMRIGWKSRWDRTRVLAPCGVLLGMAMLGGCVQVTAPDKPIVIELNVNIRQEVIYRLAADAGNTIEENEDIF